MGVNIVNVSTQSPPHQALLISHSFTTFFHCLWTGLFYHLNKTQYSSPNDPHEYIYIQLNKKTKWLYIYIYMYLFCSLWIWRHRPCWRLSEWKNEQERKQKNSGMFQHVCCVLSYSNFRESERGREREFGKRRWIEEIG